MPAADLLRGGAARPAPPRPRAAYANPPVIQMSSPIAGAVHGAGTIIVPRPAPPRAPAAYVNPPPPQVRGHWIVKNGRPVLIHAVGPGKWVEGPAPGSLAPPAPKSERAPSHTDVTSGGYASKAVDAFKQTDAYRKSVLDVFLHQGPYQQQAIVSGALKNPVSPEGGMILDYLRSQLIPPGALPHGLGVVPMREPGIPRPKAAYANAIPPAPGWAKGAPFAMAAIPAVRNIPLSGIEKVLSNAAMDVANMPSGTLQGLYSIGKETVPGISDVMTGDFADALKHARNVLHQTVDPFLQVASDPIGSLYRHPVNTLLMASGLKSLLGRGVGAAGRAAGAEWASTAREPLHIGTIQGRASPITEERSYSRDVINRAFQRAREASIKARGGDPNLVAESRIPFDWIKHSFNVGAEAKLNRIADEMSSVRQTLGRAERARVLKEAMAEAPSQESRHVVGHILQGVIRKPETAMADAAQEVRRLKAVRTHKRSIHGYWNKRQVRDLETAMNTSGAFDNAFAAAARVRPTIHGQDAELLQRGLLSPSQLDAKLFPYAQAHMGATFDRDVGRLINANHPDGLPSDVIREHLKANDVPDPAYVGHYENRAASWRYYKRYNLSRGSLGPKHRTGEAFRIGGYDHTYDGLLGQIANRAEAITKAQLHDKVVTRLGIKKPPQVIAKQVRRRFAQMRTDLAKAKDPAERAQIQARARRDVAGLRTGYYTPAEAKDAMYATTHDDLGNLTDLEVVPVTAFPAKGPGLIRDLQDPGTLTLPEHEVNALANAIHDAANRTDQTRNVVLVPKVAVARFTRQFERSNAHRGLLARTTQQFRQTVLPYSTHWMLQIQTEAALRAALAGVLSPRNLIRGRALMKRLQETEQGRAALAETLGSMFWTQHQQFGIHHDPNMFVRGAKTLPVSRHIIKAHQLYAGGISHAMTMLERNFRSMGLGKLAHDQIQEFSNSWQGGVRTQSRLIDELARGLETNPALVAKFGRQIDHMFGQYSKFSPTVRAAIQSYAPFLSWYLTAAKYVFWQLPAHHPVSSALLASLRQTINQDVADGKQMPLNPFAMQSFGTLSPFGIFTPEDMSGNKIMQEATQKATSLVLPQAQGPLLALAGVNPFGEGPIMGPGGAVKPQSGQARAVAAQELIESMVPLAQKARQIREGGRPAYGTSSFFAPQPKPDTGSGSWERIVNRTLNPLYGFERALHVQPKGKSRAEPSPIGSTSFGSTGLGRSFP